MLRRVSEIARTCLILNFMACRSIMSNLIGQTPVRYFSSLILGFLTIIHFNVLIAVLFRVIVSFHNDSREVGYKV
jgi:hypothetical protein